MSQLARVARLHQNQETLHTVLNSFQSQSLFYWGQLRHTLIMSTATQTRIFICSTVSVMSEAVSQVPLSKRRVGTAKKQKGAAVGPDGFQPPAPINTGRGPAATRPPALHIPEQGSGGGGLPDTPLSPIETPRSRSARQSTQVRACFSVRGT